MSARSGARRLLRSGALPVAAALGVSLAVLPAAQAQAAATTSDDEQVLVDEDFSADGLPAGWTPAAGAWSVADGRLQSVANGGGTNRIGFGPQATPENFRIETAGGSRACGSSPAGP